MYLLLFVLCVKQQMKTYITFPQDYSLIGYESCRCDSIGSSSPKKRKRDDDSGTGDDNGSGNDTDCTADFCHDHVDDTASAPAKRQRDESFSINVQMCDSSSCDIRVKNTTTVLEAKVLIQAKIGALPTSLTLLTTESEDPLQDEFTMERCELHEFANVFA